MNKVRAVEVVMGRMSLLAQGCVLLLLLLAWSGCTKEPSPPPVAFEYTTYNLVKVNGEPLPGIVSKSEDLHIEILSGSLALEKDPQRSPDNPGGNFTMVETSRVVPKGQPPAANSTRESTGIFFANPAEMKFRFHGNATKDFSAKVTDREIMIVFDDGRAMTFSR